MRRDILSTAATLLLAAAAPAQIQVGQVTNDYVDVMAFRVKPDRRADFDAIVKQMVEANRQNQGDRWIAWETSYGEWQSVYFTAFHPNYASIEQSGESFRSAMTKAVGPEGLAKMLQDFNQTVVSGRAEIRTRRLDLSNNVPAEPAARAKDVGSARWLRTTIVRVRAGHTADYEAMLRTIKTAYDRAMLSRARYVSQSSAGERGAVFYVSSIGRGLSDLQSLPPLADVLGRDGYQRYLSVAKEAVLSTEVIILRALPELSNPPEEVVAAAPEFWRPPPPPPPAKPKAAKKKKKQ